MFGAKTQKPTKLYSNDEFVMHLYRTSYDFLFYMHIPKDNVPAWSTKIKPQLARRYDRNFMEAAGGGPGGPTTVRYRNAAGQWRFQGGPGLKATQVYPPAFGRQATCHRYDDELLLFFYTWVSSLLYWVSTPLYLAGCSHWIKFWTSDKTCAFPLAWSNPFRPGSQELWPLRIQSFTTGRLGRLHPRPLGWCPVVWLDYCGYLT